jgi:predicted deacylase
MPDRDAFLRANTPEVAAKVIDGEAVLINLSNGKYYSMVGVGSVVWELLANGASATDVTAEVVRRYDVTTDRARHDIEGLVDLLLREGLVVVTEPSMQDMEVSSSPSPTKSPYEPPHLEIYTDMGELLALDPPMPGLDDIPWSDEPDEPRR